MLYTKDRELIVKEAWEWVGTPYRGWSRAKRWGCDCIGLVAGVFIKAGYISGEGAIASIPKSYSLQHGQHEETTEYVDGILKFMDEIKEHEALPGDVVMFKIVNSKAFAHSGIVVKWPMVIHCAAQGGCRAADGLHTPLLAGAARRFFTLK